MRMVVKETVAKGVAILDITKKGAVDVSSWRNKKPVFYHEKCVSCGLCVSYCPEAALKIGADGKPSIDLRFCKGCGICAFECPVKAITMMEET